jgi:hypothetical protein
LHLTESFIDGKKYRLHLKIFPACARSANRLFANSPLDPDCADEETEAKVANRAYHKRIVEGRDAFYDTYGPEIDPGALVNVLKSKDDILAAIIAAGGSEKKPRRSPKPT